MYNVIGLLAKVHNHIVKNHYVNFKQVNPEFNYLTVYSQQLNKRTHDQQRIYLLTMTLGDEMKYFFRKASQ